MSMIKRYEHPERSLASRQYGGLFGDLFSDLFDNALGYAVSEGWPKVDIEETDEAYLIKAELPGMSKDQVNIEIRNNVLSLSGEKKETREEKSKNVHRRESYIGSFCRNFSLPDQVATEKVDAEFKDGILRLTIPKSEEKKPRRITIR
ncbi:MAG TPA: Hsp20/alpha crystallin family protein [bacterium]|nr:Hsp20/alpha crystallin family protein [bacterium]